jgi:lysyl-tRNA synthetase class 2
MSEKAVPLNDYRQIRLDKLQEWAKRQIPYPGRFDKTHSAALLKEKEDGTEGVRCGGRLMAFRDMGKLAFGQLQDSSGRIQIAFKGDVLGLEEYKFLTKNIDLGDHLGVEGHLFTTQKGEKTLMVHSCQLLSKALRALPEKWHGIADPELRARQRYLDLLTSEETRRRFQIRHQVIKFIRQYLDSHDFMEVDTPILQAAAAGAAARPFTTHHNALDMPLYLRISPETYLKRLIAGGYERVYELGRCFRNEGIDPSHLQEFSMLEYYAAYWDYKDNMRFIQKMFQELVKAVTGGTSIVYQGVQLEFGGEWPQVTYRDAVLEYTKIDLDQVDSFESLASQVKAQNLAMPLEKYKSFPALIDGLYKKFCRPHLVQPMFLIHHPVELVPLARSHDEDPRRLDMFQILINSWEVVKAYSELVDPILQREKLEEQQRMAAAGDDETMMLEEDFLEAMEHGMPPISGLGVGIERFVALLSDSHNIRDVIYFPALRSAPSA